MTWKRAEKKRQRNVFCNVTFYGSKTAKARKKMFGISKVGEKKKKMEIPGFYYGIFIKYLYKLYKEDIHLFKYIHPLRWMAQVQGH